MADLSVVCGVPIERYPEPLRSTLMLTWCGWPGSRLAAAILDEAQRWVHAHRARFGHPPGERCTPGCRD